MFGLEFVFGDASFALEPLKLLISLPLLFSLIGFPILVVAYFARVSFFKEFSFFDETDDFFIHAIRQAIVNTPQHLSDVYQPPKLTQGQPKKTPLKHTAKLFEAEERKYVPIPSPKREKISKGKKIKPNHSENLEVEKSKIENMRKKHEPARSIEWFFMDKVLRYTPDLYSKVLIHLWCGFDPQYDNRYFVFLDRNKIYDLLKKKGKAEHYKEIERYSVRGRIVRGFNATGYKNCEHEEGRQDQEASFKLKSKGNASRYRLFFKVVDVTDDGQHLLYPSSYHKTH